MGKGKPITIRLSDEEIASLVKIHTSPGHPVSSVHRLCEDIIRVRILEDKVGDEVSKVILLEWWHELTERMYGDLVKMGVDLLGIPCDEWTPGMLWEALKRWVGENK